MTSRIPLHRLAPPAKQYHDWRLVVPWPDSIDPNGGENADSSSPALGRHPRGGRLRHRPFRAKTKGKVERPIRYLRESFAYARDSVGDEDLNAQAETWLRDTANVRRHRTTKEKPRDHFERDERASLLMLAGRLYPSLILRRRPAAPATTLPLPRIQVERRPLKAYAAIAAGAL